MASTIPYKEHMSALKEAWDTANSLAYKNAKFLLKHNYKDPMSKVYFLTIQKGKIMNISSNNFEDNTEDFVLKERVCIIDWRRRINSTSTIDNTFLLHLKNWLDNNTKILGLGSIELFLLTIMLHPELVARYPRFYAVSQQKQKEFKNVILRRRLPPSEIVNDFHEFLTLIKKRHDYVAPSRERPAHRYQLRPRMPAVVYYP